MMVAFNILTPWDVCVAFGMRLWPASALPRRPRWQSKADLWIWTFGTDTRWAMCMLMFTAAKALNGLFVRHGRLSCRPAGPKGLMCIKKKHKGNAQWNKKSKINRWLVSPICSPLLFLSGCCFSPCGTLLSGASLSFHLIRTACPPHWNLASIISAACSALSPCSVHCAQTDAKV